MTAKCMLQVCRQHCLLISQVAKKYNVPADMIKDVLKRTKKGLLVHFDDDMISRFQDEDDFIIDLTFDNQKGCFNLLIHY